MTETTTGSPWTEEDVERASEAAWFYFKSQDGGNPNAHEALLAAMDALAPRVTKIVERERRAAKVEVLKEVAQAWCWSAWSDVLTLRLGAIEDGNAVGAWLRARAAETERGA